MKKISFILLLLPTLAFASIGSDINVLLKRFFGGEEESTAHQPVPEPTNVEIPLPEIPKNPTPEHLREVQKDILLEEDELEAAESEIEESSAKLHDILEKRNKYETELFLLDTELGRAKGKLDELITEEQKWKEELAQVTREKSDLLTMIRVEKRTYGEFLQKNYLRKEQFGLEDVSLLKWLLSDKTVSKLLEENQRARHFELKKKSRLEKMNKLKRELYVKERYMTALFGSLESLRYKKAQEYRGLSNFAGRKANAVARLQFSEGKTQKELDNLRRLQADATLELQSLRWKMKGIRDKLGHEDNEPYSVEESINIFDFPLKIPMKITAHFHGEKYKKEFGMEHKGVDFFAPQGTDIFAPADGKVIKTGSNGFGYSYFILQHKDGFHTVYGHVSDILVNEGHIAEKGDLIGKTGGESGARGSGYMTSGPHLHFEMLRGGKFIDPMRFLSEILT